MDVKQQDTAPDEQSDQGVPQDWRFFAAFITMAVVNLVVALDAMSISVALPVREQLLYWLTIR